MAANLSCNGSVTGTNGNDFIKGGSGSDNCAGGGGTDTINGASGIDRLFGDFGTADNLSGGPNNDFLNVADAGTGDKVSGGLDNGGPGDVCLVDPGDLIDGTAVATTDDTDLSATGFGTCETVEVTF